VRVRLGLAAWSNSHFDNALYPVRTLHADYLPRYATKFDVAEADLLHHRMPEAGLLRSWVDQTPDDFLFLPKMHKGVTHAGAAPAQAALAVEAAERFLEGLAPLREAGRLGPVLLQFPPSLEREAGWELVQGLLRTAGPGTFAVEVRHGSWFVPAFEELLADHEAPLAWSTYPGAFAPPWATAGRGYVRFTGRHGPRRGRYVTVADRSKEVAEMARRVRQAPWQECLAIVTNPFEGNAVDSLPKVAEALGGTELAARFRRAPMEPLFPDRTRQAML
jgi:uncharacterized protein YecE (DUF72 family)